MYYCLVYICKYYVENLSAYSKYYKTRYLQFRCK